MAGIGYSPYTGAGNLASAFGANPNFGGSVGGYGGGTGGYQSGGYQYPNNVGGVNYSGAAPSGYAWGANGLVPIGTGQAGIQAYNPAIATSPTRSFQAPSFTNSMSNWLGGGNNVADSVYANIASPFAGEMMGQGDPSGGGGYTAAQIRAGYGGGGGATLSVDRFGNPAGTASQGSFNSPYDPQNTAFNMMYNNQISPALGLNNLARYANAFNNFGYGNPQAGQAMGSVAGGESSGNPFAVNPSPSSGAFGMNQWLGSRATNANNLLGYSPAQIRAGYGGGYGISSPETQAAVASSEIRGGGLSPSIYNTLNNPNSSMTQMQSAGLNQFEAPAQSDRPAEMQRIVNYGNQLTPSALANAAASIAQYQPQQGQGRY